MIRIFTSPHVGNQDFRGD